MFRLPIFLFGLMLLTGYSCRSSIGASDSCRCSEQHILLKEEYWITRYKVNPKGMDGMYEQLEIKVIDSTAFQKKKLVELKDSTVLQVCYNRISAWMSEPEYFTTGSVKLLSWTDSSMTLEHNIHMQSPEYRLGNKFKLKGKVRYQLH